MPKILGPGAELKATGGDETILPQRLHMVWFGGPAPDVVLARARAWAAIHPGYQIMLWDERAVLDLARSSGDTEVAGLIERSANFAAASDVARFEVLRRYGGVYLDADMEPCRPIDPLMSLPGGFIARESRWLINACVIGLPANSLFSELALRLMTHLSAGDELGNFASGPPMITELCRGIVDFGLQTIAVLPEWAFFPYNPFRFPRTSRRGAQAYGIHLYDHSWLSGDEMSPLRRLARYAQPALPRDIAVGARRRTQLAARRAVLSLLQQAIQSGEADAN